MSLPLMCYTERQDAHDGDRAGSGTANRFGSHRFCSTASKCAEGRKTDNEESYSRQRGRSRGVAEE